MSIMNLLYVIYRENIFSPLVKGQVLDILFKNKSNIKIHLLWIKRIDYYFKNTIAKFQIFNFKHV